MSEFFFRFFQYCEYQIYKYQNYREDDYRDHIHRVRILKSVFILCLTLFGILACGPASANVTVKEVVSQSGIKAWLVQDDKLPIISMSFAFKGGVEQDPLDKQGLAELATSLLTEGAGPYSAEDFQEKLSDKNIALGIEAGRDNLTGNIKTLSEFKEDAFEMARLALLEPTFSPADFERAKARQLTQMRLEMGSAEWQARRALFAQIFAGHPYSMRHFGTPKSLEQLSIQDVLAFLKTHLAKNNLVVGVAGNISPEDLSQALDKIFGGLPEKADLKEITSAKWPETSARILVKRPGTQSQILFALPAPYRKTQEWYATQIANYILGGGGFSSRLMQEVRDKAGLTYGVSLGVAAMDHASIFVGQMAAENNKANDAWEITKKTWAEFVKNGPTSSEIKAAKDYLTGSLPLQLTSTSAIAGILVSMQLEELGQDYLDKYDQYIRAVPPEEIRATLDKWFDLNKANLVLVGMPQPFDATETQEPTKN